MRAWLIAALGAIALTGSAFAADKALRVSADTPEKTPSGAAFTLAKDWALATHDHYVVASSSENDTFFVFADTPQAKDAADAVMQAWAMYRPDAHRKVKTITARPGRNGWDERRVVESKCGFVRLGEGC